MVQTPDSSIPSFVAELVRAAIEIERLKPWEVRKVLFRAITTVSDLREQVGIPGSGTGLDAIVGLIAVANHIERQSNERMSAALLEACPDPVSCPRQRRRDHHDLQEQLDSLVAMVAHGAEFG